MSAVNSKKSTSTLLILSVGVLATLFVTYFIVTRTNISPKVGASRKTSAVGILRKDQNHKYSCNLVAKADYVLVDKTNKTNCIPVVANPSQADQNVGKEVEVSGDSASGQFFAVHFRRFESTSSPTPITTIKPLFSPKPELSPSSKYPEYSPRSYSK